MERPKIVDRIIYSGNRELAVTYKKAAVRLLESCRLQASFNKLGNYELKQGFPDGTVIVAKVVGGVSTARVESPWPPVEKKEMSIYGPKLVVIVGNESIGYKVALVSTAEDAKPKLRKFDKMREIIQLIPPARQRELYSRRFSIKTDRQSYDIGEPIYELYVGSDQKIHLFNDGASISGPRCNPVTSTGEYCPYSPVNPEILTCHEENTGSTELLKYLLANDIVHQVDLGFTARAWCYQRVGNYSYWAEKREVSYTANHAHNRISFGAELTLKDSHSTAESFQGDSLMTYGQLVTRRWKCSNDWRDLEPAPNEEYGIAALVCLTIERVATPLGPAILLSDNTHTFEMIKGVYNSDPDQFTYGKSEPFTYPLETETFESFMEEWDDIIKNPELRMKMYAYTDPSFFFTWGVSYTGKFISPLTKYKTALNTPAFVKSYTNTPNNGQITYNNIAAKNLSLAIKTDYGPLEVYFKTFLEGEFDYNGATKVFDKSAVRQVSMGVSSHKSLGFVDNLKTIFEMFRADDLENGLLTEDDPEPVAGTLMSYIFEWGVETDDIKRDAEVFDRINSKRASLGRPPLAWSHDLSVAARMQSDDMAHYHYLGHIGHDGSNPAHRIDGTGFCGVAVETLIIGENCAMGQDSPAEVVQAWIDSPLHYAAMINPKFSEIGIGITSDETGKLYWCTVFAGDNDS